MPNQATSGVLSDTQPHPSASFDSCGCCCCCCCCCCFFGVFVVTLFFGVLFLHVFAPRRKAAIVRELIPGLSNMLRKEQMTEGESFSAPHVQVILFSLFTGCGKFRGNLAGFDFWGSPTPLHLKPGHLKWHFSAHSSV